MPKIPPRPSPKVTTHLTHEGTLIGDSYNSYFYSERKRLTLSADVAKEWKLYSKAEKEQALAFLAANSEPWKLEIYNHWFLTTYRNLDSGRHYRTIGCSVIGPGITYRQLKLYLRIQ